MSFLEVSGVARQDDDIVRVSGISFRMGAGERLAVVGETGSGKSTLLRIIAGLEQADAGTVTFEGSPVKGPLEQLIPGHPRIAYLSQHFELRNHYRVHELMKMASRVSPEEADTIYAVCGIEHLLRRKTSQLSGGERQRIAIARLLTTAPSLMILDEPFSNLDLGRKNELREVLSDAGARLGITFLLASHDPQDVMAWAGHVLVLRSGALVDEGNPESLYRNPPSQYTAGLFGRYNLVRYGDRPVMLRPGDVELMASRGAFGSLTGTVMAVRFQGFYWEVDVEISGQIMSAFVLDQAYEVGQRIGVRIKNWVAVDWS